MSLAHPDHHTIRTVAARTEWRWSDLQPLGVAYLLLTALWVAIGKGIMASSAITEFDTDVSKWFEARRTPRLDDLTLIGSTLGDTPVKVGLTVLVVLIMVAVWRRALEPLMVVAPLILEASVFITVTWIVGRPRPAVHRLEGSPVDSSFPSGHVAAAAVYSAMVIVLFWHTRNRLVRGAAVALVALIVLAVGYARLYRGMHHLTDLVAGTLLGLVSVAICWWFIRARRNTIENAHVVANDEKDAMHHV